MNIEREVIRENTLEIPCVLVKPQAPRGVALIVHGYGGSKEEQLGGTDGQQEKETLTFRERERLLYPAEVWI